MGSENSQDPGIENEEVQQIEKFLFMPQFKPDAQLSIKEKERLIKIEQVRNIGTNPNIKNGGCSSIYTGCILSSETPYRIISVIIKLNQPLSTSNSNSGLIIRAQNEISVSLELDSNHFVKTHFAYEIPEGQKKSLAFIIQQCQGDLTSEYITTLKNKKKLILGYQVAVAISQLHQQGFIHRDIKPQNILYKTIWSENNQSSTIIPKICDFGQVKVISSDPKFDSKINSAGTNTFMSPEAIKNPIEISMKSDVWSFGVTLFNLFFSIYPFRPKAETDMEMLLEIHMAQKHQYNIEKLLEERKIGESEPSMDTILENQDPSLSRSSSQIEDIQKQFGYPRWSDNVKILFQNEQEEGEEESKTQLTESNIPPPELQKGDSVKTNVSTTSNIAFYKNNSTNILDIMQDLIFQIFKRKPNDRPDMVEVVNYMEEKILKLCNYSQYLNEWGMRIDLKEFKYYTDQEIVQNDIFISQVNGVIKRRQNDFFQLNLEDSNIGDGGIYQLVSLIYFNRIFKLNFRNCRKITASGWYEVFKNKWQKCCNFLVYLDVSSTNITDQAIEEMAKKVVNQLVYLKMNNCRAISATGWIKFLSSIRLSRGIQEIDFSNNINLTILALRRLSRSCYLMDSLKKLELKNLEGITSDGWEQFFNNMYTLRQLVKIEYLDISNNRLLTGKALQKVPFLIKTLKHAQFSHLEGVAEDSWDKFFDSFISEKSQQSLHQEANKNDSLCSLNLNNSAVGLNTMTTITHLLYGLKYLDLESCFKITDEDFETIFEVWSIELQSLETFILKNSNIGFQGLKQLAASHFFKKLNFLNLSDCDKIPDFAWVDFFRFIQGFDIPLQQLSLSNTYSLPGIKFLANSVLFLEIEELHLDGLLINEGKHIHSKVRSYNKSRSLEEESKDQSPEMRRSDIKQSFRKQDDELFCHWVIFAEEIGKIKIDQIRIRILNLKNNYLNNKFFEKLAQTVITKSLIQINLKNDQNLIVANDDQISSFLQQNSAKPVLKSLNMSHYQFWDSFIQQLVDVSNILSIIRSLNLSHCQNFSDLGIAYIFKNWPKTNYQLKNLNFSNTQFASQSMQSMIKLLKVQFINIEIIKLQSCQFLQDEDIYNFLQEFPLHNSAIKKIIFNGTRFGQKSLLELGQLHRHQSIIFFDAVIQSHLADEIKLIK